VGKWENGEMGKWGNGEMGKWESGEMGKWESGKVGKWGNGEMDQIKNKKLEIKNKFNKSNNFWAKGSVTFDLQCGILSPTTSKKSDI
jgi:hypothetical protein